MHLCPGPEFKDSLTLVQSETPVCPDTASKYAQHGPLRDALRLQHCACTCKARQAGRFLASFLNLHTSCQTQVEPLDSELPVLGTQAESREPLTRDSGTGSLVLTPRGGSPGSAALPARATGHALSEALLK